MRLKSLLNRMRRLRDRSSVRALMRGERGFTLVEVLVAVAILGVIGVAFLSALSTGYLALVLADEQTMSESLTRTEFENIKNDSYDFVISDNYSALGGLYHVYVEVEELGDPGQEYPIKLVTVRVEHQGETVLTTETYKIEPNIYYQ